MLVGDRAGRRSRPSPCRPGNRHRRNSRRRRPRRNRSAAPCVIAGLPPSVIRVTKVSTLVPVAASALATDSVEGQRGRPSGVMRFDLLKVVGSSPAFLASPEAVSLARAARRSSAVQIWAWVSMDERRAGRAVPRGRRIRYVGIITLESSAGKRFCSGRLESAARRAHRVRPHPARSRNRDRSVRPPVPPAAARPRPRGRARSRRSRRLRLMPVGARAADPPELAVRAFGLNFPNPVGLARRLRQERRGAGRAAASRLRLRRGRHRHAAAAGRAIRGRACSGSRPTAAVINRLGFNNEGAPAVLARLAARAAKPAASSASISAPTRIPPTAPTTMCG